MPGRIPDWMPIIGTKDKVDYWFGDNTADEIESGQWSGMLPGDQSGASQYVPGVGAPTPEGHGYIHNSIPVIGTKENAMNAVNTVGNAVGAAAGTVADTAAGAFDYMTSPSSITDFDMNDPESVKALQEKLGVTADGMFGPETERAYRLAVDKERQANNQESLKYDYNEQVADEKKFKPFGGLFRNAYQNMDQKLFGGKLPGGFKDSNIMTAEEMYNK
jgi:hypothetical protein